MCEGSRDHIAFSVSRFLCLLCHKKAARSDHFKKHLAQCQMLHGVSEQQYQQMQHMVHQQTLGQQQQQGVGREEKVKVEQLQLQSACV